MTAGKAAKIIYICTTPGDRDVFFVNWVVGKIVRGEE